MRIVHQSAADSYFSLPFLALPAPTIAGLLPARTLSSEPPIDAPMPYLFDRPALADLSDSQRTRLFEAADILLEIAIEVLVGAFEESALRAAEVLFHRAVGGKAPLRQVGPAAFHAEIDADWLEIIAEAKRARPVSPADAESMVAELRRRQMGGAA